VTDSKYHTPEAGKLEGRVFAPRTAGELAEAIELIFDYRGDVTLELRSGEKVEGYVFNRDLHAPRPFVEVFSRTQPDLRRIFNDEIAVIALTGVDTASGKSWDAWMAKKESQRKAEADQVAAEARARGHL
jgi:hypothetical protein